MKIIKTITTILMISVANFLYAETIGLKLGYVAFDPNSWNPDIYKRVYRDELVIGNNNQISLGTFTQPFNSDTNFYYPFGVFYSWDKNLFLEANFYQFKKTTLRGQGIGFINPNINSIIFHEVDHVREMANLKLGINLMSQGLNDGMFDLILLVGGSLTHHGYSKNAVGYSNSGLAFFTNQNGSFDARIFNPLIGLEFAIPLDSYYRQTFFLYGKYESYPERSNKINYILNNFTFTGSNINVNLENIESDYSLSKQYYEAGFGFYLATDFLIKLAYTKEVNLVKFKNYNGYTLSFNNNITSLSDIYNVAELLSDKFYVYNGTNKEQIEGIFVGFEKAINF